MAAKCRGVVSETDSSPQCESNSSRMARRRRMELRKMKLVDGLTPPETEDKIKRPRLRGYSKFCDKAVEYSSDEENQLRLVMTNKGPVDPILSRSLHVQSVEVATKCKERLHELVKEELENKEGNEDWELVMDRRFSCMEKEVIEWNKSGVRATCRCEMQTPECYVVGSTAVVAVVTSDKIIVANCGDSRAILCRDGRAIPLSNYQKPDHSDKLNRIQEAGGRVIY